MGLEEAINGLLKTREALRSTRGITDPNFISEQMQRLAQYTGAVEEHLANYEEQLEEKEMDLFKHQTNVQGKSINQAEIITRMETGDLKGQVAKLKRYVNSSWQIVGVAQSRFNHLQKQTTGQI